MFVTGSASVWGSALRILTVALTSGGRVTGKHVIVATGVSPVQPQDSTWVTAPAPACQQIRAAAATSRPGGSFTHTDARGKLLRINRIC